jgi:hypothetical protein
VNALTSLHRVLRPGGLILGVQPDAVGHREVFVQIDGRESNVGTISWASEFVVSMQKARLALDECVESGLFRRGDEQEFLFREYHDTEDSWQETLGELYVGTLNVDEDMMNQARDLMPEGRSEIVTVEGVRALVLHRI